MWRTARLGTELSFDFPLEHKSLVYHVAGLKFDLFGTSVVATVGVPRLNTLSGLFSTLSPFALGSFVKRLHFLPWRAAPISANVTFERFAVDSIDFITSRFHRRRGRRPMRAESS